MFPIGDENPTTRTPYVTYVILGSCILIFLWQISLPKDLFMGIKNFGLVPSDVYLYKIISSMFLHGSWMHLIGNMAYLWIFGNNIEDYLGHIKFLIFYLFCGVCATLLHVFSDVNSTIPVVGASGAISGILGAYLLLYPKAKVRLLVWFGIVTILRVKASIVLIFWFAYQFLSVLKSTSQGGGVAWWAHIGGFIAGILVIFLFRKKNKSNLVEKGPWE
ncbi:MAG: rhomboid family intramembrane serine protease [Pelagibacteraceae bacterium]|nr:rhomboid family intramembrane serine protease [Pelagibacteraceae bacterium]